MREWRDVEREGESLLGSGADTNKAIVQQREREEGEEEVESIRVLCIQ